MEHIILSGFSDEIAPELDLQLAALQEWDVTHLELRAADGVNVSDFTPEKVREVKAKLEAAGISVSSIGSPLGKIGIQEDFAPHLDKLKRTLEIQKELGAPYVRMFSFYIPRIKTRRTSGRKCWTGWAAWWKRPKLGTACCSTRTRKTSTGTTPLAAKN